MSMGYTFDKIEIEGVVAARQIIAASKNKEMSLLGYDTEPGEFPFETWMLMADLVLDTEQSNQ